MNILSKKFIMILSILGLILTLMPHSLLAKDKISEIFDADNEAILDDLYIKKVEIADYRTEIHKLESNLKSIKKGEKIYLQFAKIAKTVLIVGVIIGSYKLHFPPGMRAMVGAYVTVTGISEGMIKLNDAEVTKMLDNFTKLSERLKLSEAQIHSQISYYCGTGISHYSCAN